MSELLTVKKPINFTKTESEDVLSLVKHINKHKDKNEKKETYGSLVRKKAIESIRKDLKQIEKTKK